MRNSAGPRIREEIPERGEQAVGDRVHAARHQRRDQIPHFENIADPKRVAIYGGSYGGYATLAGLRSRPSSNAAGVSYVGPSNIINASEFHSPDWTPMKKVFDVRWWTCRNRREKDAGGSIPSTLRRTSGLPPRRAGGQRPRVRKASRTGSSLRSATAGMRSSILWPDEGTALPPRQQMALYAADGKFLARYVGGRCRIPSHPG